jgi:hypothetical protein
MEPEKLCESRSPICCDRKPETLLVLQTCYMLCPLELDTLHLVRAHEEPWRSRAMPHDQSTWKTRSKVST